MQFSAMHFVIDNRNSYVAFCGTDVKYQDVLRNLNVLDYEYSFSLVDAFLKGDYPTALVTFDEILLWKVYFCIFSLVL